MASNREDIELAFNIEMKTRETMSQISKIDKALRNMGTKGPKLEALDPKSVQKYQEELKAVNRQLKYVTRSLSAKKNSALAEEFKAVGKASADLTKVIHTQQAKVKRFEDQYEREKDKDVRDSLKKTIELEKKRSVEIIESARRTRQQKLKVLTEKMKKTGATRELERGAAKAGSVDKLMAHQTGKEIGQGLKDAMSALRGKDLLGVSQAGLKISSDILKGLAKGSTKLGQSISARGFNAGGGKKKGVVAGGARAMGGAMKGIGSLVSTLSKLGPILSSTLGFFGAMVKMLMDVESKAKEMNKALMEGADVSGFMYENGKATGGAFNRLDKILDQVRGDATDIQENMKWGTKADDIIKTTNALAQQGVTLKSMDQAFQNAGKSSDIAARQVQGFGDMARMSFAYSRLMGVSINEITDLQAEMFTDMGVSVSGMKLEFARLTKEANESGIATNKFFAILRGVSSDLGLYTTRIGQAATMLKLLGKVMNPREASKYMSTLSKGMKEMSEEERLRMTLIVGEGKMRGIVTKDLESKTKLAYADMAKQAGITVEKVAEYVKGGDKGIAELMKKVPEGAQAAFRSFLSEKAMDEAELKSGGTVGVANAAQNLSMGSSFEAFKEALQRFGGKKKLKDMTGVQGLAARKAAGVSMEQFRQMAKLEGAIDDQKERMLEVLKNPPTTEEGKALLSRMTDLGITSEKALKDAGSDDVINAMTKGDQDNLAASQEQTDYAAETFKATTTMSDKMDMVVEGIFEFLYVKLKGIIQIIQDVFDMLLKKFSISDPKADVRKRGDILTGSKNAGNAGLINAMMNASSNAKDVGEQKGKWIEVLGPALQKGMTDAVAGQKQSEFEKYKAAKEDPNLGGHKLVGDELKNLNEEFENFYKNQLSLHSKMGPKMSKSLTDIYESFRDDKGVVNTGKVKSMTDMAVGIDPGKREAFKKAIDGGKNLEEAAQAASFSVDDVQQLMAKSLHGMDKLAETVPNLAVLKGQSGPTVASTAQSSQKQAPAASPTGQQSAAAKAAAPGTGVSAAPAAATSSLSAPEAAFAAASSASASASTSPGSSFFGGAALEGTSGSQSAADAITTGGVETVNSLQNLWDALRRQGVKIDKGQLNGDIKKSIEEGVLAGARKALFEYAMYSASDPKALLDRMQKSGTGVSGMAKSYAEDSANRDFLGANAAGGLVTGVSGGLANISPAPGEGLASIGKGERIVPAGGGGGSTPINLNVNGLGGSDLANYLKAKIAEGIYEYKRREKFN